jgi:hypothetical protein
LFLIKKNVSFSRLLLQNVALSPRTGHDNMLPENVYFDFSNRENNVHRMAGVSE